MKHSTECHRCGGGTNNPLGPCTCALHPAARHFAHQKRQEVVVTLPGVALAVVICGLSSLGLGFLVYLIARFLGLL